MEENQNKMKKSTKYLIIGTLVLFLSVLGASVAYYLARVSGNLSGRAAGTEMELTITPLSSNATGDLIPLDNDLETLGLAAKGYENNGACVDINGYSVCQIYRVRVSNKGSVPLQVNGTVTLYGQDTPNIDCAKMDDEDSITNNNSCMGTNTLANNVTLPANNHLDYYVMVYIKNLDEPQYDKGEFNGTVVFTSTQGNRVKGRFKPGENLVEHITDLYNSADKTIVHHSAYVLDDNSSSTSGVNNTNNKVNSMLLAYHEPETPGTPAVIDYHYATSVNLMNDRLGGTTESLDGGNLRYYGADPNNYIDIGDRTSDNQVILWRIIGVFDGKIRLVRDEAIGGYSWDTSSSDINSGNGINEWSQADLMKLLNPGFEGNQDFDTDGTTKIPVNNSLYWNSESGKCYNEESYTNTNCDFTNTGLSDEAKEYVVDQTLYLGGFDTTNVFANQSYILERGSNVFTDFDDYYNDNITRTTRWTGKVGLPYQSDYGYATDFTKCTNTLSMYGRDECKKNDWLFSNYGYWTVSPGSSYAYDVWHVSSDGNVVNYSAYDGNGVRPVLTLASETLAETGDGSKQKPFVLAS